MRTITAVAISAFVHNRPFRLANTSVHVDTEPATVYLKLHGHTIAQKNIDTGEIKITLPPDGTLAPRETVLTDCRAFAFLTKSTGCISQRPIIRRPLSGMAF